MTELLYETVGLTVFGIHAESSVIIVKLLPTVKSAISNSGEVPSKKPPFGFS